MIYLASPYSHPSRSTRLRRFCAACEAAAYLLKRRKPVFSPIVHAHMIATNGGMATDWDTWREFDLHMLALADELYVLKLPGWETSKGVEAEMQAAIVQCIPITYLDPKDVGVQE